MSSSSGGCRRGRGDDELCEGGEKGQALLRFLCTSTQPSSQRRRPLLLPALASSSLSSHLLTAGRGEAVAVLCASVSGAGGSAACLMHRRSERSCTRGGRGGTLERQTKGDAGSDEAEAEAEAAVEAEAERAHNGRVGKRGEAADGCSHTTSSSHSSSTCSKRSSSPTSSSLPSPSVLRLSVGLFRLPLSSSGRRLQEPLIDDDAAEGEEGREGEAATAEAAAGRATKPLWLWWLRRGTGAPWMGKGEAQPSDGASGEEETEGEEAEEAEKGEEGREVEEGLKWSSEAVLAVDSGVPCADAAEDTDGEFA